MALSLFEKVVQNIFLWGGTNNRRAATGISSINTDNAAHYNDVRQAFLHLELDAKSEFAMTDAWRGAWTPQQWAVSAGSLTKS